MQFLERIRGSNGMSKKMHLLTKKRHKTTSCKCSQKKVVAFEKQ